MPRDSPWRIRSRTTDQSQLIEPRVDDRRPTLRFDEIFAARYRSAIIYVAFNAAGIEKRSFRRSDGGSFGASLLVAAAATRYTTRDAENFEKRRTRAREKGLSSDAAAVGHLNQHHPRARYLAFGRYTHVPASPDTEYREQRFRYRPAMRPQRRRRSTASSPTPLPHLSRSRSPASPHRRLVARFSNCSGCSLRGVEDAETTPAPWPRGSSR